jgi:curved DNA-binding protein CbpA
MTASDYYSILHINKDASTDEIKKAYRNLAKKYHPDICKDLNAEEKFKQINEAYETLSDPTKRSSYDALNQNNTNDQAIFWNNKGLEFFKNGYYNDAINAFNQALKLDPTNPIIQDNLLKVYKELQRTKPPYRNTPPQESPPQNDSKKYGEPIKKAPTLFTVNGIGLKMYGCTRYFTFIFIPIIPIDRYSCTNNGKTYTFFGKLNLHIWQRIWQCIIAIFIIWILFSPHSSVSETNSNINSNLLQYTPEITMTPNIQDTAIPLLKGWNNQKSQYLQEGSTNTYYFDYNGPDNTKLIQIEAQSQSTNEINIVAGFGYIPSFDNHAYDYLSNPAARKSQATIQINSPKQGRYFITIQGIKGEGQTQIYWQTY